MGIQVVAYDRVSSNITMISLRSSCALVVLAVLVTSSLASFGHRKHQGGHNRKSKEQCGSDGKFYSSLCCLIDTHGCAKKGGHELGDGHVAPKADKFCKKPKNISEAKVAKRVVRSDENWTGVQVCASVGGEAQTFESRCLFHKAKCEAMNAGCGNGTRPDDAIEVRMVHVSACGNCDRSVLCKKLTKKMSVLDKLGEKGKRIEEVIEKLESTDNNGKAPKKKDRIEQKKERLMNKQKGLENRMGNTENRISHLGCPCDMSMAKCEAFRDGKPIPKRKERKTICKKPAPSPKLE